MSRKIVGITCSTRNATERSGPLQTLNRAYTRAVENAGGVPVALPITDDPTLATRSLQALDGLLLSGGVDVAPALYGEQPIPELGDVDPGRDAVEMHLIRAALAAEIPIFAICRGIQSLNVAMGGTLYQDLPTQRPSELHHSQTADGIPRNQPSHSIEISPNTRLASIIGAPTMRVNSFHHQALHKVAPGLVVTAYAPDGVIEAAESPDHPFLLAVQFHPEETAPTDLNSHRLFEAFIDAL